MQKKSIEKQKIEKVKLKNGLEIYFLFDKVFTTSSIQMLFEIGWRNDTEDERGLTHLFEHLIGKRTKKYPGKSEFAEKLEISGIVSNAWTGPDSTVYFQNQTNENLFLSLGLLFEAIYNTNFLEEDLEKEKKVVLTEARRYLDNDSSIIWLEIMKNLYSGTTMQKFFFGDEETMKNITLGHFEEFYKIYKNPKNSILFVGTNDTKNKQKIVKFVEDFYKKEEHKKLLTNAKIKGYVDKVGEIKKYSLINKNDKSQSRLRLVYGMDGKYTVKEAIVFGVMRQILVGGLTGKLMKILRDEMGLVYNIDVWFNYNKQGIIYAGFSTECAKDKKELVIETVKDYIYNKFSDELCESDIKKTIPVREYQTQKPVFVGSDIGELMDSVVYNYKYIQTAEGLEILHGIKVEDVKKLAKKIFRDENSTFIVLE